MNRDYVVKYIINELGADINDKRFERKRENYQPFSC